MSHAYLNGPKDGALVRKKRVQVTYGKSSATYEEIQEAVAENFSRVDPRLITISVDVDENLWVEVK